MRHAKNVSTRLAARTVALGLAILLAPGALFGQLDQPVGTGTNAPIQEIAPGIFQIGKVRLDKVQKTVHFPAAVNMTEGLIEYLIVTETGKTHESLLRTATEPYHIQIAMLLLGGKGAPANAFTNQPAGGQIIGNKTGKDTSPPIPGDPVTVTITWQDKGKTNQLAIEDLVLNLQTKSPMSRGAFTFNGSHVWEGTFIAQREGSILSTITDADAVFNNPRPGRDNDEIWQISTNKVPAAKTPVTVNITLKSAVKKP